MSTATEFLEFRLGDERAALPLAQVREVVGDVPVERDPSDPEFLAGRAGVRGEAVPVLDLRDRLGMRASSGAVKIIIADHGSTGPLGLRVDSVAGLRVVDDAAVSPVPRRYGGAGADLVRGLASDGGALVVLLDVDRLLTAAEAGAITKTRAPAPAPEGPE